MKGCDCIKTSQKIFRIFTLSICLAIALSSNNKVYANITNPNLNKCNNEIVNSEDTIISDNSEYDICSITNNSNNNISTDTDLPEEKDDSVNSKNSTDNNEFKQSDTKVEEYNHEVDDSLTGSENINENIYVDEDDVVLLAKLIYGESRGNTDEAQCLTASVVMNRVKHPKYPNTIYDVIHQPGQYSVANKIDSYTPTEKELKNARIVLSGQFECPDNVVYQAMFKQGTGVYKCINGEYYCYR